MGKHQNLPQYQHTADDEAKARALSWKMFLIIGAAAAAFAGSVYFFVL
jgi:hypothetical protein